jgi:polar amino acid transport system substrate-binding protein/glutamate/aspartate transport system substrate-binding protein
MGSISRTFATLALASATLWASAAGAGTLEDIRQSKTLRIAYDPGAPPFSYIVPGSPATAQPLGYSIELCRSIADLFKEQLKIPDLKVAYVVVNSQDRFDAIISGKADLLCESATATLARRQKVDFSIPIFIDGASFVIRPDGPRDVKFFAGKKVAVLPGTTTEEELRRALTGTRINAEVVLVKTNQEGIDAVESGKVSAYFADRATLVFLLRKEKQAANLLMAETYLSVEPIALALRRGDNDFRLAVDTALSHIYRRGEIQVVFKAAFGVLSTPSPLLASLWQVSGLPD